MADTPVQDRKAGLPRKRVEGKFVTAYTPALALDICGRIASGETLREICECDGMPHRTTFNRWVSATPKLREMYMAARALSAYAFEDEAIDLARELRLDPGTAQKVRAYEVLFNQLRWSAARRNQQEFSDKAGVKVVVPIQINTNLDLEGDTEGIGGTKDHPNIYEVDALVEQTPEPSDEPFVDLEAQEPPENFAKDYAKRRKSDEKEQHNMKPKKGKAVRR